ncbi:MAG: glycosyltransferase [Chloroflexi bacterium]|nr:MAG: glycosyltransferase [Chloroflexota bacterium]
MKILFLSRWFPYPANNGSKLRIFNLLRGLATQHEIVLLSFTEPDEQADVDAPELREICSEVYAVPHKGFSPRSKQALLGFFNPYPRSVLDKFSQEMADRIQAIMKSRAIDLVVASQVDMAGYCDYFAGTPAIFEEIEVGVLYEQYAQAETLAARSRYWLTWQKHRAYLRHLMNHFQAATVVSDRERVLLRQQAFGDNHLLGVVSNGVSHSDYDDVVVDVKPNTMIYTGSFSFGPNYEAMVWFLSEVFPLVLAEIPDAEVIITGKHGNRPLPMTENVTLAGFVDDIRPFVKSSTISLAPIWTGGGTRLKILEAMAMDTPVVATSKGAEGLDIVSGEHMMIADDPDQFAQSVIKILKDDSLRQTLARNAKTLFLNQYDWQVIMPRFFQLIDEVTAQTVGKIPANV